MQLYNVQSCKFDNTGLRFFLFFFLKTPDKSNTLCYNADMQHRSIRIGSNTVSCRIPEELYQKIKNSAAQNFNSFNQEVLRILHITLNVDGRDIDSVWKKLNATCEGEKLSICLLTLLEEFCTGKLSDTSLLKILSDEYFRINPSGPGEFRKKVSGPPYSYILSRFPNKTMKEILLQAGVPREKLKEWRERRKS
jgi:hypothetical protein